VTDTTKDTVMEMLAKYGFSTVVAVGLAFFIRQDLLIPLLDEHRLTLREVRETQREIADAIGEQTRLLIAIQSGRPVTLRADANAAAPEPGT
jgi:hypothetical protein